MSLLVLAACGGDGEAPVIDAGADVTDAAPDAPPDAPPAPAGTRRYAISQLTVPTTPEQATALAVDLDGNSNVDNQLGRLMAALAALGLPTAPATTQAVDRGTILMLAELSSASLTQGAATLALRAGASATPTPCANANDTTCRRHLAGTGTFTLAAGEPSGTPLAGTIAGGVLTAGPGAEQLQLAFAGTPPITLDLVGARVRVAMLADGTLGQGIIAGGIRQTTIDTQLYPALHASAAAAMTADCPVTSAPDCGCATGSTGAAWRTLLDTSQDCTISLEEVSSSSLFQALLAPDITLDGQPALSVGVGFSAVHAAW